MAGLYAIKERRKMNTSITDATTIISSVWSGIMGLMSNPIIAIGIGVAFVSIGIGLFNRFVKRAKSTK